MRPTKLFQFKVIALAILFFSIANCKSRRNGQLRAIEGEREQVIVAAEYKCEVGASYLLIGPSENLQEEFNKGSAEASDKPLEGGDGSEVLDAIDSTEGFADVEGKPEEKEDNPEKDPIKQGEDSLGLSGTKKGDFVEVVPYKGSGKKENLKLKVGTDIVRFLGYPKIVSKSGEILDLWESAKNREKVEISVIEQGRDRPSTQRYLIDASYLACAQGDPSEKYIAEKVELESKDRKELVTALSLVDFRAGKTINWYKQFNDTDISSIWTIRCQVKPLKSCISKVNKTVAAMQKDGNRSPREWYQAQVQETQLCLLGKSGLGYTADSDEKDANCIPNKKSAKGYGTSDWTRCSYGIFDALTAYGVSPATDDYTDTMIDRLCASDVKTVKKTFYGFLRRFGDAVTRRDTKKRESLDNSVLVATDEVQERIKMRKRLEKPIYCNPNFPFLSSLLSNKSFDWRSFDAHEAYYIQLMKDCEERAAPSPTRSLLCDASEAMQFIAMFPLKDARIANREILYRACKSPSLAFKFLKKVNGEPLEEKEEEKEESDEADEQTEKDVKDKDETDSKADEEDKGLVDLDDLEDGKSVFSPEKNESTSKGEADEEEKEKEKEKEKEENNDEPTVDESDFTDDFFK